jgi:hypothetical protein
MPRAQENGIKVGYYLTFFRRLIIFPPNRYARGKGWSLKIKKVSFIKSSFVLQRAPADFFYFYPLRSRLRPYVSREECSAKKKVRVKMKRRSVLKGKCGRRAPCKRLCVESCHCPLGIMRRRQLLRALRSKRQGNHIRRSSIG